MARVNCRVPIFLLNVVQHRCDFRRHVVRYQLLHISSKVPLGLLQRDIEYRHVPQYHRFQSAMEMKRRGRRHLECQTSTCLTYVPWTCPGLVDTYPLREEGGPNAQDTSTVFRRIPAAAR